MYVILVYDIGEKRVGKMLKLCRRYLTRIQNSVFEGEISESKWEELKIKAKKIMNPEIDSLIIFKSRDERWLDKEVVGYEKLPTDTIFKNCLQIISVIDPFCNLLTICHILKIQNLSSLFLEKSSILH